MLRARIGLVGYFGHGNYGDELFIDVYQKYFHDCELVVLPERVAADRSPSLETLIDGVDAIIIGGGDLFIPKYFAANYFNDLFLRKPVFFHGVGVPLWIGEDPKVVQQMARFVTHKNVRKINARDVESSSWIQTKLAPTVPIDYSADMVFSLDFPRVERDPKNKVLGLVTRKLTPGTTRWDHIAQLCDRARGFGYEIHNIVLGTGHIRTDDLEGLKEFDYPNMVTIDPNSIFGLTKAIGRCDVLASTKFHGCVVAAAYGIPAITLTTTDKFLSLYKMMDRRDLIGHFIHTDIAERLGKYMAPIPRSTREELRSDAVAGMRKLRTQLLDEII